MARSDRLKIESTEISSPDHSKQTLQPADGESCYRANSGTRGETGTRSAPTEFSWLLHKPKALLNLQSHPDGNNVGMNCGEAVGLTVIHIHVHMILRYRGICTTSGVIFGA